MLHNYTIPFVLNQTGSYQVGVFEGGRTFGECKMAALGQLINSDKMMGGGMGYGGPFSPMAMNPFMSMFGGMYGNQQPNGIVSNTAVVSTGTTMYSGLIRGVSWVVVVLVVVVVVVVMVMTTARTQADRVVLLSPSKTLRLKTFLSSPNISVNQHCLGFTLVSLYNVSACECVRACVRE